MEALARCPLCDAAAEGGPSCQGCGALFEVAGCGIGAPLGAGGTSRVFVAKRRADGATVAVKVLDIGDTESWKSYDLFMRGTRVLQGLSHAGLPRVIAMERDERGRLYQVRELFEGGTLRERIATYGGIPSSAHARELVLRLLRVLQYLHERMPPIVHRDIKPSNVMFRSTDDWQPVLIDFESIAMAQSSTGTTIVVSPGYTAPEQLGGSVTPQSDLYSLAATMVYACTGNEPDDTLRGPRTTAKLFPGMDRNTAEVLLQMLEPIPQQRVPSATQALRLLQRSDAAPTLGADGHPVGRVVRVVLGLGTLLFLSLGALSLAGTVRTSRFQESVSGLGLDFGRTTDRVIVQSVKGVAADVGVGVSDCAVTRHVLRGESYGSLMAQLEKIEGIDLKHIRTPTNGDAFVVLTCDVAPYPSLPLESQQTTLTFRTAYGVPSN